MTEFEFGTRKIGKINYSFMISLPKSWLSNAGAKEGDFVHVSMNKKNDLILRVVKKDGVTEE